MPYNPDYTAESRAFEIPERLTRRFFMPSAEVPAIQLTHEQYSALRAIVEELNTIRAQVELSGKTTGTALVSGEALGIAFTLAKGLENLP